MIVKALKELGYISYKWRVSGEEIYDNLIWEDERPKPSRSELQTEIDKLQAELDAQEYARNRKLDYPSIEECLHAILDDDLTALQAKRQAVKDKYPKG